MEMSVRGKLALESWNPYDGSRTAVETRPLEQDGQACTRLQLSLDSMKSTFFLEKTGNRQEDE